MRRYTFLFMNVGGDWEGIAQRIKAEGHNIKFWLPQSDEPMAERNDCGKGIFTDDELVSDYHEVLLNVAQEDLILLVDDNGRGWEFDFLRACGFTVIGGSHYADEIEHDRTFGTKTLSKIGLNVPPTLDFKTIQQGIAFLVKQPPESRFVFKPNGGDFAGGDKTYLAKDTRDLIDYMHWVQQDMQVKGYNLESFELQTFIEGYEADFSCYFDGQNFIPESMCVTLEEKKSMDGNKGPAIGCAGQALFFTTHRSYYNKYFVNLAKELRGTGYIGQVGINNIFSKKDGQPYALEFSSRAGWDSQVGEMIIHQAAGERLSDFYLSLVHKAKFTYHPELISLAVRCYTGSISDKKKEIGGRLFSFDPAIEKDLWFYNVKKQGKQYLVENNPVLVAGVASKTITGAKNALYEDVLKKLTLPDASYRMEIGDRVKECVSFLKTKGWL